MRPTRKYSYGHLIVYSFLKIVSLEEIQYILRFKRLFIYCFNKTASKDFGTVRLITNLDST